MFFEPDMVLKAHQKNHALLAFKIGIPGGWKESSDAYVEQVTEELEAVSEDSDDIVEEVTF